MSIKLLVIPMKTYTILLFLFLFLISPLSAQNKVFPYQDGEKWGLVEESGELILEPTYDFIWFFRNPDQADAYTFFQDEEKQGIINRKGKVLVKPKFDQITLLCDTRYMVYRNGEKYGFYDRDKRKTLTDAVYDFGVFPLSRDCRWVRTKQNGKQGLWADGKELLPPIYSYISIYKTDPCPTFIATIEDTAFYYNCEMQVVRKEVYEPSIAEIEELVELDDSMFGGEGRPKSPKQLLQEKVGPEISIYESFNNANGEFLAFARKKEGQYGILKGDGSPLLPLEYQSIIRPEGHMGSIPGLEHYAFVKTYDGKGAYVSLEDGTVYLPR